LIAQKELFSHNGIQRMDMALFIPCHRPLWKNARKVGILARYMASSLMNF
jgi:hypothetical protein